MLQKYDAERSESDRKWQAAMWGVELKDDPTKAHKPSSSNGRKQTMTQQDIMRNYGSKSGGGKGGSGSGIQ